MEVKSIPRNQVEMMGAGLGEQPASVVASLPGGASVGRKGQKQLPYVYQWDEMDVFGLFLGVKWVKLTHQAMPEQSDRFYLRFGIGKDA